MHEFTITEAQEKLPDLVDEALKGEDVIIKKDSLSGVRLTVLSNSRKPQFGSAQGLIEIAADFDAPLADFEACS
jgi:antitoxin (DNA-binding transcriptional repressor) of toxin-antitoxin stability system